MPVFLLIIAFLIPAVPQAYKTHTIYISHLKAKQQGNHFQISTNIPLILLVLDKCQQCSHKIITLFHSKSIDKWYRGLCVSNVKKLALQALLSGVSEVFLLIGTIFRPKILNVIVKCVWNNMSHLLLGSMYSANRACRVLEDVVFTLLS